MRSLLGRFHRPFARSADEQLLSLNNLGDGSTLSLDFTTGVLDPRLTFTRSTSGTYIGADGLVKTMAAAPTNDPTKARFDYDPTSIGTPRGLLIEASAVNYMLESTSLSGYSNSNMVAVSSGSETDPEGNANSAKQIYAAATTGYHSHFRTVTAGTNTTITVSIWAKARNYIYLSLADVSSGRAAVRFNLQTGATDNNFGAGYVSAKATPYTNGWWRCEMVVSVVASTAYAWGFVGVPTSGATLNQFGAQYTGTGNAADGIYCYGFQVEGGSGASSYIPTGASQGSRAADSCVMTGTNFSSWFAGATEGVLFAECHRPTKIPTPAADHAIVGTRYANGQGLWIYASATNQYPSAYIFPTGGAQFAGGIATQIPLISKHAVRWFDGNDITNFGNGTQGTTNTAGTGTMVPTMLTIGANSTSGTEAGLEWFNGCIRRVKFWPTALPNATIQALTT